MLLPLQYFYAISSLFGFRPIAQKLVTPLPGDRLTPTQNSIQELPVGNDAENTVDVQDTNIADLGLHFLDEVQNDSRLKLPWWYTEWKDACGDNPLTAPLTTLTCRNDPLLRPSHGYRRFTVDSVYRGQGYCSFWLGPLEAIAHGEPLALATSEQKRCPPWRIRDPENLCRRVWLCVFPNSPNERMMKAKCPAGKERDYTGLCAKSYKYLKVLSQ